MHWLTLIAVLLLPTAAHAQQRPLRNRPDAPAPVVHTVHNAAWDRVVSAEIQLVPLGPVGVFGLMIEVAPIPELVFSVGGGVSMDGWRGAISVRPQVRTHPRGALGLDVGLSMGPYTELCLFCERDLTRYDRAAFFNLGPSYEFRWHNGVKLRLLMGWKMIFAGGGCRGPCDLLPERRHTMYGGMTLGWAIGT